MVFASTGPLTIKEENLETKAKNLLKKAIHVQNGESKTFCAEGNIHEEIEFLINNEYIRGGEIFFILKSIPFLFS